jgi:hypothetical protein
MFGNGKKCLLPENIRLGFCGQFFLSTYRYAVVGFKILQAFP